MFLFDTVLFDALIFDLGGGAAPASQVAVARSYRVRSVAGIYRGRGSGARFLLRSVIGHWRAAT